jgi:ferredoxin, 2Fe-2S
MPIATFITPDGRRCTVEAANGMSLMQAATSAGIASIIGECGGAMSCATCHVMVEPEFTHHMNVASETEMQMLDFTAAPRQSNSRLPCQIVMCEELAGITVYVADPQR